MLEFPASPVSAQRAASAGPLAELLPLPATGTSIPFSEVYVAKNETDTALTINEKIAEGLDIVFSPGEPVRARESQGGHERASPLSITPEASVV